MAGWFDGLWGFNRQYFWQEAEKAQLLLTRLNPEPRDPAAYSYKRIVEASVSPGLELLLSQALYAGWVSLANRYQYRLNSDWEELGNYATDLESVYRHLFDRTYMALPASTQNRLAVCLPLIYTAVRGHPELAVQLADFDEITSRAKQAEY